MISDLPETGEVLYQMCAYIWRRKSEKLFWIGGSERLTRELTSFLSVRISSLIMVETFAVSVQGTMEYYGLPVQLLLHLLSAQGQ